MSGTVDVKFVTRDLDDEVIARVRATGYPCHVLPAGASEAEDLKATKTACGDGRNILITDSHDFSEQYYASLHTSGIPILSFDDYADVAYASDLVINHNITAATFAYRVSPHTRLLLGPKYFPLREQFRRFLEDPRRVRERVETVVITLGGMPEPEAASKILDGLRGWARQSGVRVTLVMGVQASAEEVGQVEPHLPPLGQVVVNPEDLAALLWEADLAIVNGSVTAYETAALGTPLVMTAMADNQTDAVAGFAEQGAAVTLPAVQDLSHDAVRSAVVTLADDPRRREKLARAGKALVDGKGTDRILEAAAALSSDEPIRAGKGERWTTN